MVSKDCFPKTVKLCWLLFSILVLLKLITWWWFLYGNSLKKNNCVTLGGIKNQDWTKISRSISEWTVLFSSPYFTPIIPFNVWCQSFSLHSTNTVQMFNECLLCMTYCSNVLSTILEKVEELTRQKLCPHEAYILVWDSKWINKYQTIQFWVLMNTMKKKENKIKVWREDDTEKEKFIFDSRSGKWKSSKELRWY